MSGGRAMTRARKQFSLNCLHAQVIARPPDIEIQFFLTDIVYPTIVLTKSLENENLDIFWSVHARLPPYVHGL